MRSTFFSVAKELREFKQKKSPWGFDVIPLNNADNVFTAR